MKKIVTNTSAVLLAGALIFGSTLSASATEGEEPPVTPEETTSAPIEEVPTPAEEEVPPPAEEEVVPETEPTTEQPVVTPPKEETPKHETKQLKWTLPEGGTWPQAVFDGNLIPCGTTVTVQVDTYPYTTEADKARTDALDDDGFLREGEDYGWAQSWYFEDYTAPACAAPVAHIQDYVTCDGGAFVLDALGSNVDITYTINGVDYVVPAGTAIHTDANGAALIQPTADGYIVSASYGDEVLWTKTFEPKDTWSCPAAPANPNAVITAVCGEANLVLTNPLIKDANQITASFVVFVDGEFYDAYSVEAGATVEDSFEFGEDTGDHLIEVYQAGTSEWKLIQSATVTSDCEVPPTTPEEPEEPTTPTTPEQPEKPTTPEQPAPVKASVTTDHLAQTGGSDMALLGLAGVLALLTGGATLLSRRFIASK